MLRTDETRQDASSRFTCAVSWSEKSQRASVISKSVRLYGPIFANPHHRRSSHTVQAQAPHLRAGPSGQSRTYSGRRCRQKRKRARGRTRRRSWQPRSPSRKSARVSQRWHATVWIFGWSLTCGAGWRCFGGHLPPADVNYLELSEEERQDYHAEWPGQNEFLEVAFQDLADGRRVVKGFV